MRINLSQLKHAPEATHTFQFHKPCPFFSMGADILALEDMLGVDLKVMRAGNSFIVSGSVHARIRVVCARCLEEFIFPLEAAFEDEWALAEDLIGECDLGGCVTPSDRVDLRNSGMYQQRQDDLFCFTEEEVDVTERIMEHLILSLPMRFICSGECRGLCPQCGRNMNTDPCTCQDQAVDSRLAALAQSQWNSKK
ncbi:MAG: DUF177 domain-containing protein [Peptococcaceae bacterium]|nr:DUF177 domain-containing protein [Peptococcaceae bacterium]